MDLSYWAICLTFWAFCVFTASKELAIVYINNY